MTELKLQTFPQVSATPAEKLAVELTSGLFQAGFITSTPWNWDDKVVALMDGDQAVAIICWRYTQFLRTAHIALGGVAPSYRRRGLYRRLFDELIKRVREDHPAAVRIDGGYHVDNHASAAMAKALGRRAVSVTTTYPLEPQASDVVG